MIETFPEEQSDETRLKRARMRAWRRGMREMDLILGRFIDEKGASFDAQSMTAFEALLARKDQDLYNWVSGRDTALAAAATPEECAMIEKIRSNGAGAGILSRDGHLLETP